MTVTPTNEPPPVWPYVVPLAGFLAWTALEGQLPTTPSGAADPFWYPIAYGIKIALMGVILWICRSSLRDLRPWPSPGASALALGLGVLVAIVWVALDGWYPAIPFLSGQRIAFNPAAIDAPGRISSWLCGCSAWSSSCRSLRNCFTGRS